MLEIQELKKDNDIETSKLIEEGLKENFKNYDAYYNPDLFKLFKHYILSGNTFLIGMLEDEIIVSGGLIYEDDHTGRIIRMSVKKGYRRKGYASKMLIALEEYAAKKGHNQIVLETTNTWRKAIDFYKRNDYKVISVNNDDIHFQKKL